MAVVTYSGFVTTPLPAAVVAARLSVVTRHVEPLLVSLAVGLVHLPGNAAPGETAGRPPGRVPTPEHTSVAVVILIGPLVHTRLPSEGPGTNSLKVTSGLPDFLNGIHANPTVTPTAPPTLPTPL